MIVDEGYEDNNKSATANVIADAYLEYGKIREDKVALADILFLLTNQRVSPTSTLIWLQGQIGDFIASNPKKFIEVINDKEFFLDVGAYFLPKALAVQISPAWHRRARQGNVHEKNLNALINHFKSSCSHANLLNPFLDSLIEVSSHSRHTDIIRDIIRLQNPQQVGPRPGLPASLQRG